MSCSEDSNAVETEDIENYPTPPFSLASNHWFPINLRLYLWMAFMICSQWTIAQQAFVSGGGDFNNGSGNISLSLGQVFFQHTEDLELKISEGVQQPFEFYLVYTLDPILSDYSVRLYPNPASDLIYLEVNSGPEIQQLNFTVTDLNGRKVTSGQMERDLTSLHLAAWVPGLYLLTLFVEDEPIFSKQFMKF